MIFRGEIRCSHVVIAIELMTAVYRTWNNAATLFVALSTNVEIAWNGE